MKESAATHVCQGAESRRERRKVEEKTPTAQNTTDDTSNTLKYKNILLQSVSSQGSYKTHSPGFTELLGVAGPVLAPSVSEPCVDLSLGESAELGQAYNLSLCKHKHTFIQGSVSMSLHSRCC